jgi:hypothetical protein
MGSTDLNWSKIDALQMAQGFKTGGRQKGTPNRVTLDIRRTIAESGETPLEYMIRVMRDETVEPSRRDAMARTAAPFLHPRLLAVDNNIERDRQFVIRAPRQMKSVEKWEARVQKRLAASNGADTATEPVKCTAPICEPEDS